MHLTLLKGKLHRARVTQADLQYEGSVSIAADLMAAADILPHEQVEVYDITCGSRFSTYAIPAPAGSGVITVNGAAARLVQTGDLLIICAFVQLTPEEARAWNPRVVLLGEGNRILRVGEHSGADADAPLIP